MKEVTLRQKIEMALLLRDKTKTELVEATGIARRKIDRSGSVNGQLNCAEIQKIAEYVNAKVRVTIKLPNTKQPITCDLISHSDELLVAARGFGEMIGAECEVEFYLEDYNRVI